jgi:hypothetical protein
MSYLDLLRAATPRSVSAAADYTPPWLRTPRDVRLTAESAYWRSRAEKLAGDVRQGGVETIMAHDLHRQLEVPPSHQRSVSRPIAQAMRSLGWAKRRASTRGYRPYLWERARQREGRGAALPLSS